MKKKTWNSIHGNRLYPLHQLFSLVVTMLYVYSGLPTLRDEYHSTDDSIWSRFHRPGGPVVEHGGGCTTEGQQ